MGIFGISHMEKMMLNHVTHIENYEVQTEDGYLLSIQRIPNLSPKAVVILMHPLLTDASIWVTQGEDSLAFILSNEGYDVWLPSNRGTMLSQKHVSLTNKDYDYWNFSFHEIGICDYKAIVRFVAEKTGNDITLIGHSMGSTNLLIYASELPEETRKYIKLGIAMAAPSFSKHTTSILKYLTPLTFFLKEIIEYFKIPSYLLTNSHNPLLNFIFTKLLVWYPTNLICAHVMCSAFGWTFNEFDPDSSAKSFRFLPRGFSMKILYHYSQQILSGGRFQYYSYSEEENEKIYGSKEPPLYPIQNINIPIYLMYGAEDILCSTKDNEYLYSILPKKAQMYGKYKVMGYNHIDYFYGKNRRNRVYEHILKLLESVYK